MYVKAGSPYKAVTGKEYACISEGLSHEMQPCIYLFLPKGWNKILLQLITD